MRRSLILLLPLAGILSSGGLVTLGLVGVRGGTLHPWIGVPMAVVGVAGILLLLSCRPRRPPTYPTAGSIPPTRFHHASRDYLIRKMVDSGNGAAIDGDMERAALLHEGARRLRDLKGS